MNLAIHEMEITEEAFEQGIEQGIEQEQNKTFNRLMNSQKRGIITLEQAAEIAGMSVEEFLEKMKVSFDAYKR